MGASHYIHGYIQIYGALTPWYRTKKSPKKAQTPPPTRTKPASQSTEQLQSFGLRDRNQMIFWMISG